MSYGDNNKHFEHLKLPMTWGVMAAVGIVCVIAALLFLGDRREQVDPEAYDGRTGFDGVASLPDKALALPVHGIGDGTNWLGDYFFAVRENRILKKRLAVLQAEHDELVEMRDVNQRYEKLLNLRTEPPVDMVTARSILVSRGPFANNRLIDAGANKKIFFGNPVITENGLVGRVVGVSPDVSRVLMVTDVNSHVPVMMLRSDGRAMMDGDGGGYPRLDWVRGKDTVKVGDQILTSGDGGVFPRGLPVGEAVKGVGGEWRVRLYANRAPVDFVKVLLFKDFSQLPNADALLRSPPVSAVLPPPPMPTVQPAGAASASASSSASSAPKVAASSAASSSTAAKPKPKPKPVQAATSSSASSAMSAAPAVPELKPFTPSGTPSGAAASGGR